MINELKKYMILSLLENEDYIINDNIVYYKENKEKTKISNVLRKLLYNK